MIALSSLLPARNESPSRARLQPLLADTLDWPLLGVALALLLIGLVMVTSASIAGADRDLGQPFHYLLRQSLFALIGVCAAVLVFRISLQNWQQSGPSLLFFALFLLLLVLVPGIGKTVNGGTRWLPLGPFNLQVSELTKLLVVVYLAGYLVRRGAEVRQYWRGFVKPLLLLALIGLLLLAEPDFGATVVLTATMVVMLFVGGVRFGQFAVLGLTVAAALAALAVSSPYRLQRITAFLDPWADPFNSGFQLTQALIAIGSGGWTGHGLGASVQKLFYLPEAHTDFVFAVLAEELGLIGVTLVLIFYAVLLWRGLAIARAAAMQGLWFGAYVSYGISTWLGLQACINMGVNMGLLPTKGLTLPLLSYGGSSVIVTCCALGLLLRVGHETRLQAAQALRLKPRPAT